MRLIWMAAIPIEDGFSFEIDQDSLSDTMGAKIPNRSIGILAGTIGAGKSLISQRLILGLLENDAKVVVVTTELTTRGWIEQMHSIGYHITDYITVDRDKVMPSLYFLFQLSLDNQDISL